MSGAIFGRGPFSTWRAMAVYAQTLCVFGVADLDGSRETHNHSGIGRHHRRHIDGIGGIDGRAFGRPQACQLCAAYGALRLLSPRNLFNRQRSPPMTIPEHAFRRIPIRRRSAE
jgi:hypothetical protein